MSELTQVQLHFVRNRINHRIRFGQPDEIVKLDKYRKVALFGADKTFGYIRWRSNEHGTIDWRLYVLKTISKGHLSCIPGIAPAVKMLLSAGGKVAMKRALPVIDNLEKEALNGIENIPESYWLTLSNSLLLKQTPRQLPRNHRKITRNLEQNYAL